MTSISPVTRLYWLLVIRGPLTLTEIRAETNWTTPETNSRLARLKKTGCVRLIERRQHLGAPWWNVVTQQTSRMKAGKWQAITEQAIVEAVRA